MTTRVRRLQLLSLLCAVWLLSGCATITLREAQDHFNKGADIELRAMEGSLLSDRLDANPSDAFAALNEYRLANAVATKLIQEKSSDLKQDKLLGATYVLRAMALWRISDLEGNMLAEGEMPQATQPTGGVSTPRQELLRVLSQIEQLQSRQEITLGTRDIVLHKTLYGFYDHDGGRVENNYAQARLWFQSAYKRLNESLAGGVPQSHPIRIYVGSAQLRTLAAWNLALYNEGKTCKTNENLPSCALLRDDQKTINSETKNVVCGLQLFWKDNNVVKTRLDALAATIGSPMVSAECSR